MANSSNSSKFNISSLDFDTIKASLINFLQGQPEWTDYNFSGSGLNSILNLLSYNTTYLSFYLNMVSNEMFLDSADRRENIVSVAKQIGYLPTSRKSAQAVINFVLTPPLIPTPPATLVVPIGTTFNTMVNNVSYTFVNLEAFTLIYDAIHNQYVATNVPINEENYILINMW